MNPGKKRRLPVSQDVLIDLLISKGLITRQELAKMAETLFSANKDQDGGSIHVYEALVDLLEKKGIIAAADGDGMRMPQ